MAQVIDCSRINSLTPLHVGAARGQSLQPFDRPPHITFRGSGSNMEFILQPYLFHKSLNPIQARNKKKPVEG